MNRVLFPALLSLAFLSSLGTSCLAAIDAGDHVKISLWLERPAEQTEGPFLIHARDPVKGTDEGDFLTFCVERYRYFSPGDEYDVSGIGTTSVNTGRQMTGYTAWVFGKFVNNFGFKPNTPYNWGSMAKPKMNGTAEVPYSWGQIMNYYQDAIWAGMVTAPTSLSDIGGEKAELEINVNTTPYTDLGISLEQFGGSKWYSDYGLGLPANSPYKIIQIGTSNDYYWGQDQLTNIVPEPTSVVIWGVGGLCAAAGAALRSRKRRLEARNRWSEASRSQILSIVAGN